MAVAKPKKQKFVVTLSVEMQVGSPIWQKANLRKWLENEIAIFGEGNTAGIGKWAKVRIRTIDLD